MIKFGFNTLAMLTYGLGIRMARPAMKVEPTPRVVEFRDKPAGFVAEDKGGPTSFDDVSTEFGDKKIEVKDL